MMFVELILTQDFFGIYDDDAILVAREIFKSEVGVKRIQVFCLYNPVSLNLPNLRMYHERNSHLLGF